MAAKAPYTTQPRYLLDLTTDDKRKFLDSFDHVFSDIDGVVWTLDGGIDGASKSFSDLRRIGKRLVFITNNSARKDEIAIKKFKSVNLDVEADDIVHPVKSIVDYLKSIQFEGLLYVIGTEVVKNIIRTAGFRLIDGPTMIIEESISELARHIFDNEPVKAVVIETDFNLSSIKLIRAHRYLRNPDCKLIIGATDFLLPITKEITILGPGPYAKILEDASPNGAITLGKPGKDLAKLLLKRYNIKDPKRVLMIGDMLEQDICFGKECGFQTMLTLSGGCSREELNAQKNQKLIPDYYVESMGDFAAFLKDLNKSSV